MQCITLFECYYHQVWYRASRGSYFDNMRSVAFVGLVNFMLAIKELLKNNDILSGLLCSRKRSNKCDRSADIARVCLLHSRFDVISRQPIMQ